MNSGAFQMSIYTYNNYHFFGIFLSCKNVEINIKTKNKLSTRLFRVHKSEFVFGSGFEFGISTG